MLVIDAFRAGALVYAVILMVLVSDDYRHPLLAWLVLAVLAVWTVLLLSRYPHTARSPRPLGLMLADIAVVAGAVLVTRWLDDPQRILDGSQTLPTFYAAAPVLSWAVRYGWRGSLVASVSIAAADVAVVGAGAVNSQTVANIVLLVLGGLVVGYAAELIQQGREQLAAAVAQRAATAERERLARDIHDSVLQVLGFVHRAGAGQPGQAGELAELAGEQEARLRALIATGPASAAAEAAATGLSDLRDELIRFAGDRVTVSAPAEPILLPSFAVSALTGATGEALANVRKHAAGAQAWILVEDEPDAVTVTVRDDGPGLPSGRLDEASSTGRLGVRMSIVGRIEEVGGQVLITGPPGEGTEVEMRVPRFEWGIDG